MKTYTYEKPYFQIEVVATGVFCAAVAIWAIWATVMGSALGPILLVAAGVSLYQIWNTFIAIANPEVVTIDGDTIAFSAFGRTDTFSIKDASQFRVREFPTSGKMYVRVGDSSMVKGRYWLQTKQFTDGKELFHSLLDIEYKKHPDSLKATARTVNTKYMDKADAIDRVHAVERARKKQKVENFANNLKNALHIGKKED